MNQNQSVIPPSSPDLSQSNNNNINPEPNNPDSGSDSDSNADSLASLAELYENQNRGYMQVNEIDSDDGKVLDDGMEFPNERESDDGHLIENENVIESVNGFDMLNRDRQSFSDDDL